LLSCSANNPTYAPGVFSEAIQQPYYYEEQNFPCVAWMIRFLREWIHVITVYLYPLLYILSRSVGLFKTAFSTSALAAAQCCSQPISLSLLATGGEILACLLRHRIIAFGLLYHDNHICVHSNYKVSLEFSFTIARLHDGRIERWQADDDTIKFVSSTATFWTLSYGVGICCRVSTSFWSNWFNF
jgi:hypothetical protein